VAALPCTAEILRAKTDYANGDAAGLARLGEKVTAQLDGLAGRAPGEGA
jgi:hypothetical protein